MECPKCGEELENQTTWIRLAQHGVFTLVLLLGYWLTLKYFVSKYEAAELKSAFLMAVNLVVAVVSAYISRKGFEQIGKTPNALRVKRVKGQ